jgi:putative membrane protein insertion efficiency factor
MRHFAKLVTLRLLKGYQWAISPLFPPACRYVPTCSEYALEAVERHGPVRGAWMTLGRILRCHPLAGGGYDPVVKVRPAHTNSESSSASHHDAVRGNL